jgi:hypothetical protein
MRRLKQFQDGNAKPSSSRRSGSDRECLKTFLPEELRFVRKRKLDRFEPVGSGEASRNSRRIDTKASIIDHPRRSTTGSHGSSGLFDDPCVSYRIEEPFELLVELLHQASVSLQVIGRRPGRSTLGEAIEGDQFFEELRHSPQGYHIRPIARGLVGILVSFDENACDSDCDRCSRQHLNELPLAA